jgi:hypothetical protein
MIMLITKVSQLSGKLNSRYINLTIEEHNDYLKRSRGGELTQDILPQLSANDREFLMTGITPEEWDELFPEKDE